MQKVILSWSGGKDSALALHKVRKGGDQEIVSLLTTLTKDFDRVSMHGVRRELLERQAISVGLPLHEMFITTGAGNEEYEEGMREALLGFKAAGVTSVAFGDIFLEDVRRYRETNLSRVDMEAVFPLWGIDTASLAKEFVDLGFEAIITCVDTEQLDGSFVGRSFDRNLLKDLPSVVDPMGENGEFHTFVLDGPVFRKRIAFETGEKVLRKERFYFCDIMPTG